MNVALLILDGALAFIAGGLAYTTWRLRRESRRTVSSHSDPGPGFHSILGAVEPEPGAGADTSGDARPDPRVVTEPVKAWKFQDVRRRDDGSISIVGMWGSEYGIEAVAKCEAHRHTYPVVAPASHAVPDEQCTCGFYGLKEKPTIVGAGQYLLEVEMYGKVIPHEKGYRAEKMRVLSITARPRCTGSDPNPRYDPNERYGFEKDTTPCAGVPGFTIDGATLCARHAMESGVRFYEWSPEPVNCETEWRWAE